MPANGKPKNIATAVTEVSERMSTLVREEIELAKAEVTTKVMSIVRGTVAVAAGAVFGVFAFALALTSIAWAIDAILIGGTGDIWVGFAIVCGAMALLALVAFLVAWRKLRVGPPTPNMAIDEAKRIREVVATKSEAGP